MQFAPFVSFGKLKWTPVLGLALFPFIICRDLPLVLLGASLGFLVSRRFKTGFEWGIQKHQPDVLLPFGWRWMEKEPFVPSPTEGFAGSGRLPLHADGADMQEENQLCVAGSRQAGLPPGSRQREPVCSPPTSHRGSTEAWFSPKTVIPPGALLAWRTSPLPPHKSVPQRMKDTLLYAGIPPPFCPFCSYKSCLRKAERACRRRRCMWRITAWEVLRRAYERCLSTIKSWQKMVWHRGVSQLVLKSTGRYPCISSIILLLLFPKRSSGGIFLTRDFFLLMNYTALLLQYVVYEKQRTYIFIGLSI